MTRYSRQLILPEIGKEGQEKLANAKVLIVGVGGLGCPAAMYLAAAGIGTIGLIEYDIVEESNLNRQVLFSTEDIGKSKVKIAKIKLEKLNPLVNVQPFNERLTAENTEKIISQFDIIIEGSDNLITKYLVNDTCVKLNKPWIYGAVSKFEGRCAVFLPQKGCYRCIAPKFPDEPIGSCKDNGILGTVTGVIGTVQANEAIKLIIKKSSLINTILIYDAMKLDFSKVKIKKNPQCKIC